MGLISVEMDCTLYRSKKIGRVDVLMLHKGCTIQRRTLKDGTDRNVASGIPITSRVYSFIDVCSVLGLAGQSQRREFIADEAAKQAAKQARRFECTINSRVGLKEIICLNKANIRSHVLEV
jgi:hypothetical protein